MQINTLFLNELVNNSPNMVQSKLILLLKSFSKQEFREFSKFVASPFFNQKEDVIKMYEILKKAAPDFPEKKIKREVVMKKINPKQTFEEKQYKYLSNLLLKLAEQFISYKETERRPLIKEYHLLNAYVKRDIDKNYNFIYRKAEAYQDHSSHRDAEFYYREYLLKNVEAERFNKKRVRKNNDQVSQLLGALDIYYFSNKLKHTCHILNDQTIISNNADTFIPTSIIEYLIEHDFIKYPAVHLYLVLYQLLTVGDGKYFSEIKSILKAYHNYFENEELKEVYYTVINYSIRQIRKGERTDYYLNEAYVMYKNGIESTLLLDDGYLPPWTFKNVVKAGLRLKKYEDTEQFIIESQPMLRKEFQSDAFHYNMAEISYRRGHLDSAMEHLNQVEYSDIYYILGAKKLQLKIYYETDEFDALESLLSSFQTYLKRNKLISDDNRNTYLNFTKCLNKIIKNELKKAGLKEEIENTSPITDKNWLLEIIKK